MPSFCGGTQYRSDLDLGRQGVYVQNRKVTKSVVIDYLGTYLPKVGTYVAEYVLDGIEGMGSDHSSHSATVITVNAVRIATKIATT